jgi:replicative DNA helicase
MMNRLETIILKNLIYNEDYTRKVLPFLKSDYFTDSTERILFEKIHEFVSKYKNLPTKESLTIDLTESKNLTEPQVRGSVDLIGEIEEQKKESTDIQWLTEQTEKFCQDKAIYNAIMESVQILDNKNGQKSKGEIPKLLSTALGVSFDTNVGHDYIQDFSERFDFYHRQESRIPFDLDLFNKITKGGIPNKTLSICLAGTGVGKSMFMCHMAASCLSQGQNVLYITLEMAEERIAERIDANLLNVTMSELHRMTKDDYDRKFEALKVKTHGKLIIKEYPTAAANSLHFRALLNELHLKKSFQPQIIFIDYLNICSSARLKPGANVNSYSYIKAIAEELRGLAVEFNLPIVSATQTTRCLSLDTIVNINGKDCEISNVKVGDIIESNEQNNVVTAVYKTGKKSAYRITLSNGQTIVCSDNHVFPTKNGEKNILNGLKEGMCLMVKEEFVEILSIEKIEDVEMIDIEVTGNRLFYANGILTHNSGYNNSDVELTDTSESFGLPATADFMFALISTEELQQLNQLMVKQLKNRFGDPNHFKRFVIGVDREKMRLYDAEASAQTDIVDSGQDGGPINTFGNRESKFNRNFSELKV